MVIEETQVLIVGGGLVGLSMALFLRTHGVRVILVERHPGTAIHPRTPAYNPRTMEVYRSMGVERAIRAADDWFSEESGILCVETLAGRELGWLTPPEMTGASDDFSAVSPTAWNLCRQDRLEPVLRRQIDRLGGDLRFGVGMRSFEANDDGVSAVIEDGRGERTVVRAEYMVAADGHDSAVRRRLGIRFEGRGELDHRVSIWFRADLNRARRGRGIVLCVVRNSQVSGTLRVTSDLSALTTSYRPEQGERPEDFTEERNSRLIRAAVGEPDLEFEQRGVIPWALAARVATGFRAGRVFLAGDAAHVMPPAGAYGANTGIQDAHNLAWKLAFVLGGHAVPELLDSYEAERRPLAQFFVDQTVARWYRWFAPHAQPEGELAELLPDPTLMFGYRLTSGAVLRDASSAAALGDVSPGSAAVVAPPAALPGVRLPHLWLELNGVRLSTIDLCRSSFVLLTGASGDDWHRAGRRLADRLRLDLACHRIGPGGELHDVEDRWPAAFGLSESGAALIRPDGIIAWRAKSLEGDAESMLARAIHAILGPRAH